MNTTKFDSSKLTALLESRKVVTLEELASALGTDAKATLFRKLKEIDYRTSYSHRGRFYTLADEDKFDRLGLWSFENIRFSSYGTLRETARSLVSLSDAGLYAGELAAMLHVEVNDALLYLVKEKRLRREAFPAGHLYCSPEAKARTRQLGGRRSPRRWRGDCRRERFRASSRRPSYFFSASSTSSNGASSPGWNRSSGVTAETARWGGCSGWLKKPWRGGGGSCSTGTWNSAGRARRAAGASRSKKTPEIVAKTEALMEYETAEDPMTGLK